MVPLPKCLRFITWFKLLKLIQLSFFPRIHAYAVRISFLIFVRKGWQFPLLQNCQGKYLKSVNIPESVFIYIQAGTYWIYINLSALHAALYMSVTSGATNMLLGVSCNFIVSYPVLIFKDLDLPYVVYYEKCFIDIIKHFS